MKLFFKTGLYNYFCNQKIDDYFLKGKRGIIELDLETPYTREKNLFSLIEYSFDIFTAYSPNYLKKLGLPKDIEEDDKNPIPMTKEYIEIFNLDESFIEEKYLKNHKKFQSVLKIPEEKIDKNYFLKKKNEKKEIIDVYVDLRFRNHHTSIDVGELDLDEDFSVLEKLGYNTIMPPEEEIKKELERINIEKIYNLTLPLVNHYSVDSVLFDIDPLSFFKGIKNLLESNAQEILIPQTDYFDILNGMGKQGFEYNLNKAFSLVDLNKIREKINKFKTNPLVNLIKGIFYSLIEVLKINKKILECLNCGNLMKYKKGKKYCSYKFEGKDCGKSARNKRAYLKKKHLS